MNLLIFISFNFLSLIMNNIFKIKICYKINQESNDSIKFVHCFPFYEESIESSFFGLKGVVVFL
jgi:hypothetical protein